MEAIRAHVRVGDIDVATLCILAVPIAYLSIAAHDFALTRLGVPYPYDQAVPSVVRLIGQASRIGGLLALCRLAAPMLQFRSAFVAALIVGALNAALCETLRVIIIDDAIYGGGWGDHLLYALTDHLPLGLLSFYQGAGAAILARVLKRSVSAPLVIAVAVAAIAGMDGLLPAARTAMAALQAWLRLQPPTPLYAMPFGFHMYKYIYASFLEPTAASLFLAAIVWPGLPGGRLSRVGLYTGLILLARGRVASLLLNIFWLKYPLPLALAAEGQFFAETLILAALTGLAWDVVQQRAA